MCKHVLQRTTQSDGLKKPKTFIIADSHDLAEEGQKIFQIFHTPSTPQLPTIKNERNSNFHELTGMFHIM